MTRILDSLVSDKLVSRSSRRAMHDDTLSASPRRAKAAIKAVPKMIEPLKRAFSDLSPDELARLEELLRKVIVFFDKSAIPRRGEGLRSSDGTQVFQQLES